MKVQKLSDYLYNLSSDQGAKTQINRRESIISGPADGFNLQNTIFHATNACGWPQTSLISIRLLLKFHVFGSDPAPGPLGSCFGAVPSENLKSFNFWCNILHSCTEVIVSALTCPRHTLGPICNRAHHKNGFSE